MVGQIGMALILLIGAGLLGRSFLALRDNDLGFEVENRTAIQLFLWDLNPLEAQRIQRAEEIEQALEAVPGVEAVGIVSALPFHPSQIDAESGFSIDLRPRDPTEPLPRTYATVASPDYVQVMGIPLRQGRGFTAADREDAPLVAIINQTMADRYFAGEDPVGQRITVGVMAAPASREIVGVVADVRPTSFDSEPRPELFVPFAQNATGGLTFVVKALSDAAALIPALREQIWSVDPRQSVYHAATVESLIRDTLVERRFNLVLLGGLSLMGFLLATVGVYGLIAFATSQRRGEIAVRLALGAKRGDVMGMIVGQALRLAVIGVALGIVGALYLTRFMRSMLYDVRATDVATFAQIVALVVMAAVAAAWLPARRASRTDPMHALRRE